MLTVKRLCEQVGLPQRLDSISASSQDNLTRYAGLLGASSAQLDVLANIPIDSQRTMVRAALQRLRSRGVRKLRRGDVISLENWTELRAWEDVNPVSDRRARDGSADGSRGGAPSVSGSASSLQDAETLELRRTVKELSDKVKLLEAERGGDDNDDNANDSRKLVLSEQLWEDLPEDSVRAEISKSLLRDMLRRYPLPADYPLKAGEPSAADKTRLSAAAKEQIDALARIITRSADAVRPLLHLITALDNAEPSWGDVRTMALDSISLTLHNNSVLDVQRKKLLFGDNKVVATIFDKQLTRPLLSAAEDAQIEALYDRENHEKKMHAVLGRPATAPGKFGNRGRTISRAPPAAAAAARGENFGADAQRGRGRGKDFRQSKRFGKDKARGTGEARGDRDASARQE